MKALDNVCAHESVLGNDQNVMEITISTFEYNKKFCALNGTGVESTSCLFLDKALWMNPPLKTVNLYVFMFRNQMIRCMYLNRELDEN